LNAGSRRFVPAIAARREAEIAFFLAKVQAIDDGRFRPAGQALKVGDDRVDFFLSQAPALCFSLRIASSSFTSAIDSSLACLVTDRRIRTTSELMARAGIAENAI
jgi:hypothetical protein